MIRGLGSWIWRRLNEKEYENSIFRNCIPYGGPYQDRVTRNMANYAVELPIRWLRSLIVSITGGRRLKLISKLFEKISQSPFGGLPV